MRIIRAEHRGMGSGVREAVGLAWQRPEARRRMALAELGPNRTSAASGVRTATTLANWRRRVAVTAPGCITSGRHLTCAPNGLRGRRRWGSPQGLRRRTPRLMRWNCESNRSGELPVGFDLYEPRKM